MSADYAIASDRNLVFFRFYDQVSLEDCTDALKAFAQDPKYRPSLAHLMDFSSVDKFIMEEGDLVALVQLEQELFHDVPKGTPCASFALDDAVIQTAKAYAMLCGSTLPFRCTVHGSMADAMKAASERPRPQAVGDAGLKQGSRS